MFYGMTFKNMYSTYVYNMYVYTYNIYTYFTGIMHTCMYVCMLEKVTLDVEHNRYNALTTHTMIDV